MPASPLPGEERMWTLAAAFPSQLKDGLKAVPRHNFAENPHGGIVVAGMGGSGIAGELLGAAASRTGESLLCPLRDFRLPAWARPPMPAVFVSYSGNTAETLAAYDEAKRRNLPRAIVTSGGALLERGRKDQVLTVQVPAGQPPRASLGYLMGALAGVLRHALPEIGRDLPRDADGLAARLAEFTDPHGALADLARAWGGRNDLWVYAPDPLAPVARRWTTQFEENAKHLAHFDAVPEVLHNAIVGWDALPSEKAAERTVVLLKGRSDGSEMDRRSAYLQGALAAKGVQVLEVRAGARSPLGEVLDLTWAGDYASLWAARQLGIDPVPVPGIDRMRASLDAPAAG
jgi:glucose/mannose-6-phosphate isomerase